MGLGSSTKNENLSNTRKLTAKNFRDLTDLLAKYCDNLARTRRKRCERMIEGYLRCYEVDQNALEKLLWKELERLEENEEERTRLHRRAHISPRCLSKMTPCR